MKQSRVKQGRLPEFKCRFKELQGVMSNTEFAEFLGMSRQTVGFYLNGDRIPDALGLRDIADKCQVSADWLIGRSDVKTLDADIQQVCQFTGLSEAAIEQIEDWRSLPRNKDGAFLALLDQVLLNGAFHMMMYHICDFRNCVLAENVYWELRDKFFSVGERVLSTKEVMHRQTDFSAALEKIMGGDDYPSGVKTRLAAEHQLWNEDEGSESLRDSLFDSDGFSFSDVYEYRTSKDLAGLLNDIRNEIGKKGSEMPHTITI